MSLGELSAFTVNFFALTGIFIVIIYYWRELKAQRSRSYDFINARDLETRISHLRLLHYELHVTHDYICGLHDCINLIEDMVSENENKGNKFSSYFQLFKKGR